MPIETGSLTRSEKLFSRLSIIPYPLKIVLSLKYGRKKTFTRVEKTSQPQPLRKDPRGGTRIAMGKTFVSFDVFRRICKETLKFKSLTHISCENTTFFHFRFRAILHSKSIGVNIGTFCAHCDRVVNSI